MSLREELLDMSRHELEEQFRRGDMPNEEDLAGWEFQGVNTPAWAKIAGIRKFCKGFFKKGSELHGYNTPVEQSGGLERWRAQPSDDRPKRFGFYLVTHVDASSRDNVHLKSLLLDYGRGDTPFFSPVKGLRDYLVQPDRNDKDVYLGKAYYAAGPLRVPASFFVLKRWRRAAERT
jgi:hypothetical protein